MTWKEMGKGGEGRREHGGEVGVPRRWSSNLSICRLVVFVWWWRLSAFVAVMFTISRLGFVVGFLISSLISVPFSLNLYKESKILLCPVCNEFLRSGKIDAEPLITHRFGCSQEALEAFEASARGDVQPLDVGRLFSFSAFCVVDLIRVLLRCCIKSGLRDLTNYEFNSKLEPSL